MIVSFAFGMTTCAFFQKSLSVVRAPGSASIAHRIWLSVRARTRLQLLPYPWRMIFQYASLSCRSALLAEMIRRNVPGPGQIIQPCADPYLGKITRPPSIRQVTSGSPEAAFNSTFHPVATLLSTVYPNSCFVSLAEIVKP